MRGLVNTVFLLKLGGRLNRYMKMKAISDQRHTLQGFGFPSRFETWIKDLEQKIPCGVKFPGLGSSIQVDLGGNVFAKTLNS